MGEGQGIESAVLSPDEQNRHKLKLEEEESTQGGGVDIDKQIELADLELKKSDHLIE